MLTAAAGEDGSEVITSGSVESGDFLVRFSQVYPFHKFIQMRSSDTEKRKRGNWWWKALEEARGPRRVRRSGKEGF